MDTNYCCMSYIMASFNTNVKYANFTCSANNPQCSIILTISAQFMSFWQQHYSFTHDRGAEDGYKLLLHELYYGFF